jgi:(1->4)-alpha-D-glucan 1-alpha-D-glucosylmutase
LEAIGQKKDHVCTFARLFGNEAILVVTPRLLVGLTGGVEQPPSGEDIWKDTWLNLSLKLTGRTFRNIFTGERLSSRENGDIKRLPVAGVLGHFPVALLEQIAK